MHLIVHPLSVLIHHRGIKTLALRVHQQNTNAMALAEALQAHPNGLHFFCNHTSLYTRVHARALYSLHCIPICVFMSNRRNAPPSWPWHVCFKHLFVAADYCMLADALFLAIVEHTNWELELHQMCCLCCGTFVIDEMSTPGLTTLQAGVQLSIIYSYLSF